MDYLYQKVSDSSISLKSVPEKLAKKIDYVYDQLLLNPSNSIVVCGIDDVSAHIITNRINDLLNSNVKSKSKVSFVRNGSDSKMNNFLAKHLFERESYYRKSDHIINCNDKSIDNKT